MGEHAPDRTGPVHDNVDGIHRCTGSRARLGTSEGKGEGEAVQTVLQGAWSELSISLDQLCGTRPVSPRESVLDDVDVGGAEARIESRGAQEGPIALLYSDQ